MSLAVLTVFRCFTWAQNNNICPNMDIYQAGPLVPSLSEDSSSQPAPQVLLDIYSEWSQVCVFESCFVFLRDLFFTTETGARQTFLFCRQFIKHSLHSTFFLCFYCTRTKNRAVCEKINEIKLMQKKPVAAVVLQHCYGSILVACIKVSVNISSVPKNNISI